MPYLSGCKVSTGPLDNGIEITEGDYQEALSAMVAGRKVCAREGEMLIYSGATRTVYRKASGHVVEIAQEDETPDDCTAEPPAEYQVWGDRGWETDLPRLAELVRADREVRLASAIVLRDRHRDEIELGLPTTITSGMYNEVLVYIQALRDVPQQPGFPESFEWPISPL